MCHHFSDDYMSLICFSDCKIFEHYEFDGYACSAVYECQYTYNLLLLCRHCYLLPSYYHVCVVLLMFLIVVIWLLLLLPVIVISTAAISFFAVITMSIQHSWHCDYSCCYYDRSCCYLYPSFPWSLLILFFPLVLVVSTEPWS